MAIFLKKLWQIDITTSDYDDQEIEDNIAYNCKINGVTPALPHMKRELHMNFIFSFRYLVVNDALKSKDNCFCVVNKVMRPQTNFLSFITLEI